MVRGFAGGLEGWGLSDPSAATIEDGQLHVQVSEGQPLLLNSAPIDFQTGDQPFKLTVTATVRPLSAGSGYFTVIFLGEKELSRARIPISALDLELGTVTSGEAGQFQLPIPLLAPAGYLLRAVFAGNPDLWAAKADILLPDQYQAGAR